MPPDGNVSDQNVLHWLSINDAPECFSTSNVDLNTGAKQNALNGFNVRFDIGADANDSPDVNVRKGFVALSHPLISLK